MCMCVQWVCVCAGGGRCGCAVWVRAPVSGVDQVRCVGRPQLNLPVYTAGLLAGCARRQKGPWVRAWVSSHG